jgi:4-hydroxy-4-methyl-2-oxoglutarate aldolase
MPSPLAPAEFEKLRSLDTPTVSNAIERFDVRLRNEGFVYSTVRCMFPQLPPMLGYAVPARIRTSSPPLAGRCYYDRMDFWEYVLTIPAPRVIVIRDVDPIPGVGALVGEIHAQIARALDCKGCVTDGAVRDLPEIEALSFSLFAGSVAVSHSYAHIIEFGEPVEIGGLRIAPGDLVHGDLHGVQTIPLSIAAEIPQMAAGILKQEQELIRVCQSRDFSLEALEQQMRESDPRQLRSPHASE